MGFNMQALLTGVVAVLVCAGNARGIVVTSTTTSFTTNDDTTSDGYGSGYDYYLGESEDDFNCTTLNTLSDGSTSCEGACGEFTDACGIICTDMCDLYGDCSDYWEICEGLSFLYPPNSNEKTIRLVQYATTAESNSFYAEGLLEVYIDGDWESVCADQFGSQEQSLACQELGYEAAFFRTRSALEMDGVRDKIGIAIGSVVCDGSEGSLLDCSYEDPYVECDKSSDVGLWCYNGEGDGIDHNYPYAYYQGAEVDSSSSTSTSSSSSSSSPPVPAPSASAAWSVRMRSWSASSWSRACRAG